MSDPIANLPRELVPRKDAFLFTSVGGAAAIFGVLGLAVAGGMLGIAAPLPSALAVGAAIFAAGVGLVYWLTSIAFRKERYELHPTHLVCSKGTLISDERTELDVRNVTHVKLRLPWVRWRLFGVGHVMIESAGSGGSEVTLRCIREPEKVYDDMRLLLQHNGYSLGCSQLLHEERPDFVGVVLECLGIVATAIFALIILGIEIISSGGNPLAGLGSGSVGSTVDSLTNVIIAAFGALTALGGLAAVALHYLDMRRRTYKVYNDAVVYEEGFLTRDNAFIPYENIADANTKKNLLDMLIGLSDVHVSCQGSGSEVKFRRLRHGRKLTEAVDSLVRDASAKPKPAPLSAAPAAADPNAPIEESLLPARPERQVVAEEDAWTAQLKIDMTRSLVPLLPLVPLVPIWLLLTIAAAVRAWATKFWVRAHSVGSRFTFLSVREREFAYDKITGVVVKLNPWDMLFDTVTVRLWSIGAPEPLDLLHIKRQSIDVDALLRQAGIPPTEEQRYEADFGFGPKVWLLSSVGAGIAGLILLLAVAALVLAEPLFGLLAAPILIAMGARYAYLHALVRRQRLTFHASHVEGETGLFWKSHYHARYENVKKIELLRYPMTGQGQVKIFVAGEHRVAKNQQGKDAQQTGMAVPYQFTLGYVTELPEKFRLLDDLILGRVPATADAQPAEALEVLAESKPQLRPSLARLLLIFPLWPLLPITLPICWIAVRRWRYRVESGRVLASWGVVYERQMTVTFDSIDSLRNSQGLLGKIFGNGRVILLTAGSSQPDLILSDLPEYVEFYDVIRAHYGQV